MLGQKLARKGLETEHRNRPGLIASKNQLKRKLNIERLAGSDPRSAISIADRVGGLSESILRIWARENKRVRRRKVCPIEQVVDLRAELKFEPFADPEVLKYGEIHILKPWTIQRIAPHASESALSRQGEGGRINPLHKLGSVCSDHHIVGNAREWIAHLIHPLHKLVRARIVILREHCKWLSGVQREQPADLPSAQEPLRTL